MAKLTAQELWKARRQQPPHRGRTLTVSFWFEQDGQEHEVTLEVAEPTLRQAAQIEKMAAPAAPGDPEDVGLAAACLFVSLARQPGAEELFFQGGLDDARWLADSPPHRTLLMQVVNWLKPSEERARGN